MKPPLREVLTVIWKGSEVPGLTIYGLFARPPEELQPQFPEQVWPKSTEYST